MQHNGGADTARHFVSPRTFMGREARANKSRPKQPKLLKREINIWTVEQVRAAFLRPNMKGTNMSTGYRQRRKTSKRVWKERAGYLQQHAAIIARLVNAFMLERSGEPITFTGEQLEKAKAVDVRMTVQADGGLELVIVQNTVDASVPAA